MLLAATESAKFIFATADFFNKIGTKRTRRGVLATFVMTPAVTLRAGDSGGDVEARPRWGRMLRLVKLDLSRCGRD